MPSKLLWPLLLLLAACPREAASGDDDVPPPDANVVVYDAGVSPHPGQVWLMTWNIEAFPKAVSTVAKVAQIIQAQEPDLLVVQEIDDVAAFQQLDDMLADYSGVLADDPFGDIRVGMLYRNTVSLLAQETLFKDDSSDFPRPPLLVRVRVQGFDTDLMVLHLKAGFDSASKDRRRSAIVKLESWVRARVAAGDDDDIILAGDWNDVLTETGTSNVFGPFTSHPSDYTFLTQGIAEQAQVSGDGTFLGSDAVLDNVLVTHDAMGEYGPGSTEILFLDSSDSQYEATVTDHRPVLVKFKSP